MRKRSNVRVFIFADVLFGERVVQMIESLAQRTESDSDESRIVAGTVTPESLCEIGRARPARFAQLVAESEMPGHRGTFNYLQNALLEFCRKLPRHKVFVMLDC